MSLSEIALIAGGVAAGVASGSIILYYSTRKPLPDDEKPSSVESSEKRAEVSSKEDHEVKKTSREDTATESLSKKPSDPASSRIIPRNILEKSKRELRTFLLEKELVSAALTRLYEAEVAKEITKEERETLGAKYRDELKSLDEKILKIDAFIEVGDLETLRDQLVRLVNQKMDAIDKRIENTRKIAEPLIAQILSENAPKQKPPEAPREPIGVVKPKVPDISDMLAPEVMVQEPPQNTSPVTESQEKPPEMPITPLRRKPSEPNPSSDPQVEQLQKELLDALDRLEKLDVDSA